MTKKILGLLAMIFGFLYGLAFSWLIGGAIIVIGGMVFRGKISEKSVV